MLNSHAISGTVSSGYFKEVRSSVGDGLFWGRHGLVLAVGYIRPLRLPFFRWFCLGPTFGKYNVKSHGQACLGLPKGVSVPRTTRAWGRDPLRGWWHVWRVSGPLRLRSGQAFDCA
jgi:hypothetical protein